MKRRRRALATLVGVVFAIGGAEILLRVTGLGAPPVEKLAVVDLAADELRFHCYPSNPDGAFEPLPADIPADWNVAEFRSPPVWVGHDALATRPWCVRYRFGSLGVRGPAVAARPGPGVLRIVGIGDSFAFGEGVRFEDSLFARLDRRLGTNVEVLNCARTGADLALDVPSLEWASSAYSAPRALLVLTLNDVPSPEHGPADLMNVTDSVPAWLSWSRVGSVVQRAVTVSSRTAATERMYVDAYDPALNRARLEQATGLLRRAAGTRGVFVAVVIFPLLHRLDAHYPFESVHARLAALVRGAGLPCLDLLPAFRGQRAADLWVHPVDHHPNARAHAIAAEAVARWLQESLPDFLAR